MAIERKAQNQFGKIGVLMGGVSSEREISLKSGKAVYETLQGQGFNVVAVDITTDNIQENIRLITAHRIDCAFLALHGRFGEDGQIQKILQTLRIPYTGSDVQASHLAMDKIASRKIFAQEGLNVPKYITLHKSDPFDESKLKENDLHLPLVVKPATQGSSIGLSLVYKEEELKKAVTVAFHFDERILIEKYIKGREVTVAILEDKALPVIEIIPKKRFFDYEAKYQPGMTDYLVPAALEEKIALIIQKVGLAAHRSLGCAGFSRVDMILSEDETPFVLEVNTIPGLTSTSLVPKAAKVAGIEFSDLCLRLIELAYAKTQTCLNF